MIYKFYDMHSGGYRKTKWDVIYVEGISENEALETFYSKFGVDPYEVYCPCCSANYSITEYVDLQTALSYHSDNDTYTVLFERSK